MSDSLISSLRECARDGGVETDELRLTVFEDTYTLSVAGDTYDGLSDDELDGVLSEYDHHLEEWRFWSQTAPQGSWEWAFLRWIEDASVEKWRRGGVGGTPHWCPPGGRASRI